MKARPIDAVEMRLMSEHDNWRKRMEAEGKAQADAELDRTRWGKRMMSAIAAGGGQVQMIEPGDDWTQEMIDGSLAEEARLSEAITILDARFEEALQRMAAGERFPAGHFADLTRDRVAIQEMLSGMQRARGYRVVAKGQEDAKATDANEADQQTDH